MRTRSSYGREGAILVVVVVVIAINEIIAIVDALSSSSSSSSPPSIDDECDTARVHGRPGAMTMARIPRTIAYWHCVPRA